MTQTTPDPLPQIEAAFRRAFSLGQTYWQQADSDSYKQNAKSNETADKFDALVQDALALIRSAIAQQPRPCGDKRPCDAGEICIGCQPRECPDAQPTPAQDEAAVLAKWIEREAWSFLRNVLNQGRSIEMDYQGGKYSSYEHLSARLDEAARERRDQMEAALFGDKP